jgi:hypothetical protein
MAISIQIHQETDRNTRVLRYPEDKLRELAGVDR